MLTNIVNKFGALFLQNNLNVNVYVIFSDLKALLPLVYFLQNREDGFQDYFGKV